MRFFFAVGAGVLWYVLPPGGQAILFTLLLAVTLDLAAAQQQLARHLNDSSI